MPASNLSFHEGSDQLSPASGIALALSSAYGMIMSLLSLIFIVLKLKLNKYFKVMLAVMVIANFICSSLVGISLLQFSMRGYFLVEDCRLFSYPFVILISSPNMINIMSVLRYQISYMASEAKIIGDLTMAIIVTLVSVVNYGFTPFIVMLQEMREVKSAVTLCMNEDHYPNGLELVILALMKIIILTIVGAFHDFRLYQFVKNRNQTSTQSNVVPWKSVDKGQAENDLEVPLRATVVSIVVFVISLIVWTSGVLIVATSGNQIQPAIGIFAMLLANTLPMIVIFITISHQAKKAGAIAQAQPPAQLQFHDEDEESRDEIEMNPVMNDLDDDEMEEPTFIVNLPGIISYHL